MKGSQRSNGDAAFGDALYATSLPPSSPKKTILDNNYGAETSTNAQKANFVVELDVPSLKAQGYNVEAAPGTDRVIYMIRKDVSPDVDLGKVGHRILAKDDWMKNSAKVGSERSWDRQSKVDARQRTVDASFEVEFEASSIKWRVVTCVGPFCGEIKAHWLEWKSASSFYSYEKIDGGWRSIASQSREHGTKHTIQGTSCFFFWCSSSPVTRSSSSLASRSTMIEETGKFFKTNTKTTHDSVKHRTCTNDVCSLHTATKTVQSTKSEGLFRDQTKVKQTTCSNDVCRREVSQQTSLAAPAKAGIGAAVSSVVSCTGQQLQKKDATFGKWAEECVPAAFMSGGIGLVIGAISKVPLVGPVIPVVMQVAGLLDACSDDSKGQARCGCEVTRTLAIAVPSATVGMAFPGAWLATSFVSGGIAGVLPQCSA